ncbi:conserved hypothetical protein [Sporisorium reilianum SRZ2]|uniref:Uncharacterized protein n=1 Tax=Sporisorium reilianum (strain SRZ2) TaxID=999809 RepID=E7A2M6_SPORE|nr:conserved hypothetical protein [Sporisorium reilianum SRZ2]
MSVCNLQIKSLRHTSVEPSAGAFFTPDKGNAVHVCPDFILILKPFPRHLVDAKGCIVETKMLPHWLPMPPHPSTHQRRHLVPPLYPAPSASNKTAGEEEVRDNVDRWEPIPLAQESPSLGGSDAARPILRVFSLVTKKRIHKRAVIRHRVRTRLLTALRTAIFNLQDAKLDVQGKLDLRRNVLMLVAHPSAYAKDMEALVREMEKAVRRVAALPSAASSSAAASRKSGNRGESNKASFTPRTSPRKAKTA